MMKFTYALLASWAICLACAAQEAEWLTDLTKAKDKARADKKMVLIDFNGSDWCPPCKALRKDVFSSPQFVAYAKTNLVLVDIDFPVHKEQTEELKKTNQALSEKFKVEGYPTVVVLGSDGNELKKETGYSGQSAKEFIAELERLRKKDKT
jgi:protein disulfide-isomerase